jgi:hypothetical protein
MAGRITQAEIDTGQLPTSAKGRTTQAELDTAQLPASAKARVTQVEIDVAIGQQQLGQPFTEHGLMLVADIWQ